MQDKSIVIMLGSILLVAFLLVNSGGVLTTSTEQIKKVYGGTKGEHPINAGGYTSIYQKAYLMPMRVTKLSFWLRRDGDIQGKLYFEIRDISNTLLVSNSMNISDITTVTQNWKGKWYTLSIENSPVISGWVKIGLRLESTGTGEVGAAISVENIANNEYLIIYNNDYTNWDLYYQLTYYPAEMPDTERFTQIHNYVQSVAPNFKVNINETGYISKLAVISWEKKPVTATISYDGYIINKTVMPDKYGSVVHFTFSPWEYPRLLKKGDIVTVSFTSDAILYRSGGAETYIGRYMSIIAQQVSGSKNIDFDFIEFKKTTIQTFEPEPEPVSGGVEPTPPLPPSPTHELDTTLISIIAGVIFLCFVLYYINRRKK